VISTSISPSSLVARIQRLFLTMLICRKLWPLLLSLLLRIRERYAVPFSPYVDFNYCFRFVSAGQGSMFKKLSMRSLYSISHPSLGNIIRSRERLALWFLCNITRKYGPTSSLPRKKEGLSTWAQSLQSHQMGDIGSNPRSSLGYLQIAGL